MKSVHQIVLGFLFILSPLCIAQSTAKKQKSFTPQQWAKKFKAIGGKVTWESKQIVKLEFTNSKKLGESAWVAMGRIPTLRSIVASNEARSLNDKTIDHLIKLKNLTFLSLDGPVLTDESLAKFSQLKKLEEVKLFHVSYEKGGFTGSGLKAWTSLPNLRKLTIAGMSVGDEAFEAVSHLKQLTKLRVWHTHRTEKSNEYISKLPNLNYLMLGQRLPYKKGAPLSISNISIPNLIQMKSVETLEIGEADLLASSLSYLGVMPNLKKLILYNTYHSRKSIASLKKYLNGKGIEMVLIPQTPEQKKKLAYYLN